MAKRVKWVGRTGDRYLDAVWDAVSRSRAFATFRSDRRYNAILEHVTQEFGHEYLRRITADEVRALCMASAEADRVGSPWTCGYDSVQLSPTTLRYGKVLSDLVAMFPGLDRCESIAEIGVGYGGQARLAAEYLGAAGRRLTSYTLIDVFPVLLLARRYLENFSLPASFRFCTRSELDPQARWDLVISNYAYSEFSPALQDDYLRLVIGRAKNGYLTMNSGLMPDTPAAATLDRLLAALPNAVLTEETPLTSPGNYILVFGDHTVAGTPLAKLRERMLSLGNENQFASGKSLGRRLAHRLLSPRLHN